jgi:hypothetical protein
MRKSLILAAGIALVATSAFAQGAMRERDDSNRGGWSEGRGDRGRDFGEWRGRMMMRGDNDRDDEDRRDDNSGSGSRFYLRSGDTQLRVVCGDRESTRSCVDAALMMFDRIQPQSGSRSPSPGTSQ